MAIIKLPSVGVARSELGDILREEGKHLDGAQHYDGLQYIAFSQAHYIVGILYQALDAEVPDLEVLYSPERDMTLIEFDPDTLPPLGSEPVETLLQIGSSFYHRDMLYSITKHHLGAGKSRKDLPKKYSKWDRFMLYDFIVLLLACIAIQDNVGFTSSDSPQVIAASIDLLGYVPYAVEQNIVGHYIATQETM